MLEWISLMGPDASTVAEWTYHKRTHPHSTVMLRNVQYSPFIAYRINTTLSSCSGLYFFILIYHHPPINTLCTVTSQYFFSLCEKCVVLSMSYAELSTVSYILLLYFSLS